MVFGDANCWLKLLECQDSCPYTTAHVISQVGFVHAKPAQLYLQRYPRYEKQELPSHTSNIQESSIVKFPFPNSSNQHKPLGT